MIDDIFLYLYYSPYFRYFAMHCIILNDVGPIPLRFTCYTKVKKMRKILGPFSLIHIFYTISMVAWTIIFVESGGKPPLEIREDRWKFLVTHFFYVIMLGVWCYYCTWSHRISIHTWWDYPELGIGPSKRPLPVQHTKFTRKTIHVPIVIRTCNPRKRATTRIGVDKSVNLK